MHVKRAFVSVHVEIRILVLRYENGPGLCTHSQISSQLRGFALEFFLFFFVLPICAMPYILAHFSDASIMTSTVTPSVASGSSAAASSSTPLGTGNANSSATPVPSATQMTYDQIVAENTCRVASNAALQLLRDAGNPNVTQDEPLLPLPPSPSAGNHLQQWISAFVNLSPTSQAQGAAVLEGIAGSSRNVATRLNTTSIAKALFDSSKEIATSSGLDSTYNFGIHHFIQDLTNAGEYCPLTLFSNKNTERLHHEGHSLKRTKVHVNGVSHHLLDLSQFESECNLDPLTWQEAFQHYLSWIADVGDAPSVKRWTTHFTTLAKDEAICKNFRAILEFDMRPGKTMLYAHTNTMRLNGAIICKRRNMPPCKTNSFVIHNSFTCPWSIVPLSLALLLALSLMIRIHPPSIHSRRMKENLLPFVIPSPPSPQIPCVSFADAPAIISRHALKRLC